MTQSKAEVVDLPERKPHWESEMRDLSLMPHVFQKSYSKSKEEKLVCSCWGCSYHLSLGLGRYLTLSRALESSQIGLIDSIALLLKEQCYEQRI